MLTNGVTLQIHSHGTIQLTFQPIHHGTNIHATRVPLGSNESTEELGTAAGTSRDKDKGEAMAALPGAVAVKGEGDAKAEIAGEVEAMEAEAGEVTDKGKGEAVAEVAGVVLDKGEVEAMEAVTDIEKTLEVDADAEGGITLLVLGYLLPIVCKICNCDIWLYVIRCLSSLITVATHSLIGQRTGLWYCLWLLFFFLTTFFLELLFTLWYLAKKLSVGEQ